MKSLCHKCSKMATWNYMPGKGESIDYYCDDCVPRGCSCIENENGVEQVDPTDRLNRVFPCCEYMYNENGWYNPNVSES